MTPPPHDCRCHCEFLLFCVGRGFLEKQPQARMNPFVIVAAPRIWRSPAPQTPKAPSQPPHRPSPSRSRRAPRRADRDSLTKHGAMDDAEADHFLQPLVHRLCRQAGAHAKKRAGPAVTVGAKLEQTDRSFASGGGARNVAGRSGAKCRGRGNEGASLAYSERSMCRRRLHDRVGGEFLPVLLGTARFKIRQRDRRTR